MQRVIVPALVALGGAACNAQAVPPETPRPQVSDARACPPPHGNSTIAWMSLMDRGVVAGRVVSLNGVESIEGAVVDLIGSKRIARTVSDGRFRFDSVQAGQDSLRVRALGYVTAKTAIRVSKEFGAMAFVVLVPLPTNMDGCSDVVPARRPPAIPDFIPPAV